MTITSFEIHALPASRVVPVKHAVRIGHGGTLMIGTDGLVYYSALVRDRTFSHFIGIPTRVLAGLVSLGAITQAQADEYTAAVNAANGAFTAHCDLDALTTLAKRNGILLNEDDRDIQALRKRAALHEPNSY